MDPGARDTTVESDWLQAAELARVGLMCRPPGSDWVSMNEAAARLLGMPGTRGAPRAQLMDLIDPGNRQGLQSHWEHAVRTGTAPPDRRLRLALPGGEERFLLIRSQPVFGAAGETPGARAAVIDITGEVQAERARERERQALAERDAATTLAASKTTLLAAVGHEVRTPLNAILVATDRLARGDTADPAAQAPWLQILREASAHLQALADDLLHGLAQTEQQALVETAEPVLLSQKVERVMLWLAGPAEEAGVTLQADDSLRGVQVMAPRRRLRQVLLNLIGNGIKYNRRGGCVRCSARQGPDGMAELIVEDTGRGMSGPQLQRLFRPFDRVGREGGRVPGFGLGLYLVKRFMQEMAGDVLVQSTPGRGSRFTLRLPLATGSVAALAAHPPSAPAPACTAAQAHEPQPQVVSTRQPASAAPARHDAVLCVDDDPFVHQLLAAQCEALERLALHTATSAEQALACWSALAGAGHPAGLLMIDSQLGAIDGAQVLAALRRAGCTAPAVAYTGNADPGQRLRLLRAGFAEVWIKPLRTAELHAAPPRLLGRVQPASTLPEIGSTTPVMYPAVTGEARNT